MPDPLLRVVIQAVVEGLLKTVVHRQLGPHLGDYLRAATDGMELEMEVGVRGVPIRTFDAPLADWASGKLKSAMKWDEEAYGLEYDLDLYNIVTVKGFSSAMENKGLNISPSPLKMI